MPFGVDLGTSNSSIAWADDAGNVYSLRVRRGIKDPFDAVEPSLVFDPLGERSEVGIDARDAAANDPAATYVVSFKRRFDKPRLRGRRYEVVSMATREYDPVNQGVLNRETGQWVPVEYDDYALAEVVAAGGKVFERLLSSREFDLDPAAAARAAIDQLIGSASENTEQLFVGVPVTFGPTGRRRMLASLVASGCFGTGNAAYARALARCRFVYEPLALASTLTLFDDEPENVLVFDYGGGTLDLAVLRVTPNGAEPPAITQLAIGGRPRAGDALDADFRDHLLAQRPKLRRAYARQIKGALSNRIRADAAFANAKIRLSVGDQVTLAVFDEVVTRAELDAAIADEVEEVVASVRVALAGAELGFDQVGTVLMTGGSSLIPGVKARLRREFPALDDLAFRVGTAGDGPSELEALTGISRGLARFGFLERFESSAPCNFSVVIPGKPGQTVCLPRGAPDETSLEASPAVRVKVTGGVASTFALHSDLLREAYCGALVDVDMPAGVDEVDVRVSASRSRFVPAFTLTRPGNKRPLARFSLEDMKPAELAAFVSGDCEWLPGQRDPVAAPLVRPLTLGDFVTWEEGRSTKSGKVVSIRDFSSGEPVAEMDGFDPARYVIRVAIEIGGVVSLGRTAKHRWSMGDVRLA